MGDDYSQKLRMKIIRSILITVACAEQCDSEDIKNGICDAVQVPTLDAKSCQMVCKNANPSHIAPDGCEYWTWDGSTKICQLKKASGWYRETRGSTISGDKYGLIGMWPETALVGGDLTKKEKINDGCRQCKVHIGNNDKWAQCQPICEAIEGCAWWNVFGPTCYMYNDYEAAWRDHLEYIPNPNDDRCSGDKTGEHIWYEIHLQGAHHLEDDRCCRKITE